MPTGQQYGTNVPQTFATAPISAGATSIPVNSSSSWPATPFTAIFEIGTSLQEAIDVTTVAGNNWTVVRGVDGTTALGHAINATLTHGNIGRDFREARSHIDALSGVHGLGAGLVVGTSEVQSLSNKTLVSPTISGAVQGNVSMGSGSWTGTGTLQEAALSFSGLTGATFQTTRIVGTVNTGSAPASGTFALGDMIYDTFYQQLWVCTGAGSPGTWRPMGNRLNSVQVTAGSISVPLWATMARITWSARGASTSGGGVAITLQMNGDTGSNYSWQTLTGNTAAVAATNSAGLVSAIRLGIIPKAGDSANWFGTGEVVIAGLQNTSILKTASAIFNGPTSTTTGWSGTGGGIWNSTAAVTSLALVEGGGNGFAAGSAMYVEFRA